MKCKHCNGTGKVQKWFYERTGFGKYEKVCGDVKCEWCNGTGEVEQTEQEYLQSCKTEQLADALWEQINGAFNSGYACCNLKQDKDYTGRYKRFVEWLKQPHKE